MIPEHSSQAVYFDRYRMGKGLYGFEHTQHAGKSYQVKVLSPFARRLDRQFPDEQRRGQVLDLASGLGESARFLEATYGFNVVQIDLSQDALQHSEGKRVRSSMEENLPFRDNSFIGVHCKDAIVHVSDKKKLLAELYRVLQPGGHGVLITAEVSKSFIEYRTKSGYLGEAYITSPQDYIDKIRYYETFKNVKNITPPYYNTSAELHCYEAQKMGFVNVTRGSWYPGREIPPDWYIKPQMRRIIMFQKPEEIT